MKNNLLLKFFLLSFFGVVVFSSFASAQTQQWVARYNGLGNQTDEADFIYVDAHGNSYVGGTAYDTTGGLEQHISVVKYDSTGTQLWVAIALNPTDGYTLAGGMTVDPYGDVFVTGYADNFTLGHFIVVKFDSTGAFQWEKYCGTPSAFLAQGFAITSDANFVYVAGQDQTNSGLIYPDYKTIKLDIDSGNMQSGWPQAYNGTGNNYDTPTSIAVDGSGNVFVTGKSLNGSGNYDYVTIGYSPSGTTLTGWPQRWDGPLQEDDSPVQLVLSGSNVIVTGICNEGNSYDTTGDICTIMYTYSGTIVSGWPQIYNGTGNSWDGVGRTSSAIAYQPMAADDAGNVYVSGWTKDSTDYYDMITFKYNAAGVIQGGWPQTYHTDSINNISRGLALDASNDVCITGWTTPSLYSPNGNYITIEYDNAGNVMPGWPVIYNGTANGDDQAMAITAVGTNIWITGYSNGVGTFEDYATVKYSNSNLFVNVKSLPVSTNEVVIYPNPSSGRFTIANAEAASQLTVTNVLGDIIYQSKVTSPQTQVDLSNEAKGIYFYKLIGENKLIHDGKLILL